MVEDQTQHEGRFLEEAVKAMIRRAAEVTHAPDASSGDHSSRSSHPKEGKLVPACVRSKPARCVQEGLHEGLVRTRNDTSRLALRYVLRDARGDPFRGLLRRIPR